MTPIELQTDELKRLGEKLQQSIVLTRMRLATSKSDRIVARGRRVLENADKLFQHISQLVQAASGIRIFLERAFGVTVADLMDVTDYPRLAHGVAYTATTAINEIVKRNIDDIAAINAALDKDEERQQRKAAA